MNRSTQVAEFDFQVGHIHFRTKTLRKGINSSLPNYGLNSMADWAL